MLPFTFAGFEIQHITSSETMLTITARALTSIRTVPGKPLLNGCRNYQSRHDKPAVSTFLYLNREYVYIM